MWIGLVFSLVESLHFENIFELPPVVNLHKEIIVSGLRFDDIFDIPPVVNIHKQIAASSIFTVLEVDLVVITFSIKNGTNFVYQVSSRESMAMNLRGKSVASFSESNSERFRFVFLFE